MIWGPHAAFGPSGGDLGIAGLVGVGELADRLEARDGAPEVRAGDDLVAQLLSLVDVEDGDVVVGAATTVLSSIPEAIIAEGWPPSRSLRYWSAISAISGETTIAQPGRTSAGTW